LAKTRILSQLRCDLSQFFCSRVQLISLIFMMLISTQAVASVPRIILFGDSLTAGPGVGAQETLSAQLSERLKKSGFNTEVVNAGVSGDTTETGLARLDYTLEGGAVDLAVIELGANDMLRGLDPLKARTNLEKIITAFQAKNARILLVTMVAGENWGQTYKKAFDSIYPDLAQKFGVQLVPFIMQDIWGDPGLLIGDGLHPNAQGIAKMVDRIAPQIETVLKTTHRD
jgi:acyl-CoA thioesterase-1